MGRHHRDLRSGHELGENVLVEVGAEFDHSLAGDVQLSRKAFLLRDRNLSPEPDHSPSQRLANSGEDALSIEEGNCDRDRLAVKGLDE